VKKYGLGFDVIFSNFYAFFGVLMLIFVNEYHIRLIMIFLKEDNLYQCKMQWTFILKEEAGTNVISWRCFQSFDFEHNWWRLFQKRVVRT